MKVFAACVFLLGIIGATIWWQVYAYQDCRKVGHSKLYCVMKIGR